MEFLRSFLRLHFAGKPVVASRNVSFFLMLTTIQDGHLVCAPAVSVLGKDDYMIFSLWWCVIQRFFQKQQFSNLDVKLVKFLYNCINRLSKSFFLADGWISFFKNTRLVAFTVAFYGCHYATFIFNWHMLCYLTVTCPLDIFLFCIGSLYQQFLDGLLIELSSYRCKFIFANRVLERGLTNNKRKISPPSL